MNKTEHRDQLLYEIITERFKTEWFRTEYLDKKANNTLIVAGLLLVILSGIGSLTIMSIPKTHDFYFILCLTFISSIILLMHSALYSLKACSITSWKIVPDTEHLINRYGKENESRINILRIISSTLSITIKHNKAINDTKALSLTKSFTSLAIAFGTITSYSACLIIM